jgi:hypothetical protein
MGILAVRAYQDPALFSRFLLSEELVSTRWSDIASIFPNIEVERYAEYVHIKQMTFLRMLMDPTSVHIVAKPCVES